MTRLLILAWCLSALSDSSAAIAGQPPAAGQAKPAPAPEGPPPPPPGYTYNPDGRRDPFLSLLGRGEGPEGAGSRPTGLAGLLISEVSVKGVMKDKTGFIAILQATDNKTHPVRVGARLFDGSVKSIGTDKIVFSQDVNDPLSIVKQREVAKPVRPGEGRQ